MKICDLCGSLDIEIDDGDVQLCKRCKASLEKSMQDAKEGKVSELEYERLNKKKWVKQKG